MNNKNIKNKYIDNNSYNVQFLNSFNKIINSENNIDKNKDSNITNDKLNININGGNNHTLNNNSRNYNSYINSINSRSAYKNVHGFNSLQNNNENNYIMDNDNLYNSIKNSNELLYMSNNDNNNKIYLPLSNFDNVKIDYSIKNNIKFHEIKVSKEKSNKKINRHFKNNSKTMIDKNKIINLTSLDNSKIHKKYNNLYKIMKDNARDKK